MSYRTLSREEITKLMEIDRTETITGLYRVEDGELRLEETHLNVPDWSPAEKKRRIAILQEEYDEGATFFGAFDGDNLVGMAELCHKPMSSGDNRLELAGLWVSSPHRGKGVGRALFKMVAEEARERGAKALYVSATPSVNTIKFYRSVGFELTSRVDPERYEAEPEDIHMELTL